MFTVNWKKKENKSLKTGSLETKPYLRTVSSFSGLILKFYEEKFDYSMKLIHPVTY